MKQQIRVLLILLFISVGSYAKNETILLDAGSQHKFHINNPSIEYYQDSTNLLSYQEISTGRFDSLFHHPVDRSISEINTNIWFRFEVENQSEKEGQWILAVPDFTFIDVYLIEQSGNIEILKAGTKLPVSQKQIKNGMYELTSFSLQGNERKTVYVKAVSEVALKIQDLFTIDGVHNYYSKLGYVHFIQGLFNGLLIMMLFYNLFLFLMTRQKSYLFYSMYISGITISILALLQYFRYLFFPENPKFDAYFGFSIFFALIFYFLFIREFIDSKNNNLKLDNFLKKLVRINLIFTIVVIAISFFSFFIYALLSMLFIMGNMVVLLLLVLKEIRKRNKITQIFATGSFVLIFGIFFSVLGRLMGYSQEIILLIFQLSIVCEVFIFSAGLSYKYKLSQELEQESRDKLILQLQENEQLQKKVNLELEDKVRERTAFISKQKDEINALYREVHHRVKNNFAIILGILENKIENARMQETKEALINTSSRINSMNLIHDLIHHNFSEAAISAKEYLVQLANYVVGLKSDTMAIRPVVSCPDDLYIDMQLSVALGIIVNELMLNSLKHVKNSKGSIECQMDLCRAEDYIHLRYSDNGSCVVSDDDFKNKGSIGIYLIETMTRQMDGQLTMKIDQGFVAELSLKIPK
ncbi:MAG TPA: 7TM diverse intracellular signaling domain-containing protein [Prolixibacteraceae bacterium]|nr:7TM diverse intracellular signaling domain-containing protein [Prolixibacteraceae bacterium]